MLLPLALAASSCVGADYAAQLLNLNRGATAPQANAHGRYVSTYDYSGDSMTGIEMSTVDVDSGAFVRERKAGLTSSADGYDGRHAWMRDLSGYATPQDGGNKPALAINAAYRNANRWWKPGMDGARVIVAECDHLTVTPKGGLSFDAWFDPSTHMLARVREMQTFGTVYDTRYLDYALRAGQRVATKIEITSNDNAGSLATLRLRSVEHSASDPRRFSLPARQPVDWSVPASGSVTVPFKLLNNHIVMDVSINGHGPFPFILDTGGHDILTPSTLAALGLTSTGGAQSGGAGEKMVQNGYAKVDLVGVAGLELRDQTFVTLDFSPAAVEGIQLGGMLGVEFFERFVIDIDYGASTVTITDPAKFGAGQQRAAGTAVPIALYDHMPHVAGTFEGRAARFNIDTGSRADVTMTSPYVGRANLRAAHPDAVTVTDGWGVGGPSRSTVIRASSLTLGPVAIQRPIAGLSTAAHGSFSDAAYDGNVGSGLLKRFVTTFNYARNTMYLRPLTQPDADVGRFDRTGMWLNLGSGGMEIKDVASNGPAAEAGLQVADLVTAIDGKDVARMPLSDVRRILKLLPTDRSIIIGYLRGGSAHTASLRPRNLIPD